MADSKFGWDGSEGDGVTVTPPTAPQEGQVPPEEAAAAAAVIEEMVTAIESALLESGFTEEELNAPSDEDGEE